MYKIKVIQWFTLLILACGLPIVTCSMLFDIFPKIDRVRKLQVEHVPDTTGQGFEQFVIYGNEKIVISSNRPILVKKGIKKTRRPDYKMVTQNPKFAPYFEEVKGLIDEWVKQNLD